MSKNNFDRYLTTCFAKERDKKELYRSYEDDYGQYLPQDRQSMILDIGCGTGEFITYLRANGYGSVSGIDACPEMVEFCNRKEIKGISLVKDLSAYLAAHKETFNLITLNDTLEHLPEEDIIPILSDVKNSLKKGGILLLRTINFSTFGGIYLRHKDFTHKTAFTEFSLTQVLRLARFENIEVKGNHYRMKPHPRSILRHLLLCIWFFILRCIYLIELGNDRPRIYSKLLIAVAKS